MVLGNRVSVAIVIKSLATDSLPSVHPCGIRLSVGPVQGRDVKVRDRRTIGSIGEACGSSVHGFALISASEMAARVGISKRLRTVSSAWNDSRARETN